MTENKVQQIDVEGLIASKNKKLLTWMPKFVIRWLKKIIHQNQINQYLRDNKDADPYEFMENGIKMFGLHVNVKGKENLPDNKRVIMVSNHPLGGIDGVVFINEVHKIYGDLRFPVNDLLLNIPNLQDVFLPINKHGSHSRQAVKAIDEAYQSNLPILYFPAGLCSRKIKGKIVDLEWKKSFVTQAIKYQRDIIPVHFNGANSNFFYNLANFRKRLGLKANLEMLFLVDEMYKQYHKDVTVSFGKPIAWQSLDKSKTIQEWVDYIRSKTYEMA